MRTVRRGGRGRRLLPCLDPGLDRWRRSLQLRSPHPEGHAEDTLARASIADTLKQLGVRRGKVRRQVIDGPVEVLRAGQVDSALPDEVVAVVTAVEPAVVIRIDQEVEVNALGLRIIRW